MSDPSVSPADTIRRNVEHSRTRILPDYRCPPECKACAIEGALPALLAVGERDKAEWATERGELIDLLNEERVQRITAGERDRRQIARLTEALKRIRRLRIESQPSRFSRADRASQCLVIAQDIAAAVLAGEEDAG